MMRDKKAKQQASPQQAPAPQPSATQVPDRFGYGKEHGKSVHVLMYGSQRRYMCMAYADREKEATDVFLNFVSSFTPDSALAQNEMNKINQKLAALQQQAAQMQAMAHQKQMQTLAMQRQTSQMIARNSQEISAGLMDSWNKRMDSQSRISDNFSQAIRGVDTYSTPSGGTVEMSTVADHVYQNQYGDTIGVSGNAIDDDLAAKLNWTELQKK
jgi:small-conductance mechanosensitive channel